MTGIQRACALGALIWMVGHGPIPALLALGRTSAPGLSLLALAVLLVLTTLAIQPLRGRPLALRAGHAWLLTATVPLVGLAVMPHLAPEQWRMFGNWWPGATQVLVSALVMRRRPLPALAAELASAAVITGCVLAAHRPGVLVEVAALNQPAILWFTASLGIRTLFDRTAREVARFEADAGSAVAARATSAARADSARRRRADLGHSTVPLLRRVADSAPDDVGWPVLSRSAVLLERQLRDDLRARALVDDVVRSALLDARARGCRVDVLDDRPAGSAPVTPFVDTVRPVLAAALTACGTAHLTARLPPSEPRATLSVDGSTHEVEAVAFAIRKSTPSGIDLHLDVLAGSLWVELRPATAG